MSHYQWKYENGVWTLEHIESKQQEFLSPPKTNNHWQKPLIFYILTWLSTTWIGSLMYGNSGQFWSGLWFSIPLMIILTFHELGHYIQTRRYKVPSTLPFFIPVPLPPFGTMGAVIQMDSKIPNLRALFDIGISGPLAGLIPTLIFMFIGIGLSSLAVITPIEGGLVFGEPLLFRWVSMLFFDRSIPQTDLLLHPIAMAAWTGLFITSLNLFPIGQLDGGHIFYALLKRRAGLWSMILFGLILLMVIFFGQWQWSLMLILVMFFGIEHPPTCNDFVKLGRFRIILGYLTLAFVFIGFTPNPISETKPDIQPKPVRKTIYSLNYQEENQPTPIFITFTKQ
ncbi:MAG: site-2 protease family protein [Planctomycetia bacterium]|nr:site-2 protease family protein [Planctomycetia bacterium]